MSDILGIAVSGMNAAATRIANSAQNIVNASSTNFTPQNVVSTANANGGVTTKFIPAPAGTQVDIASELVSNIEAAASYGASAAVVKTDQKMNNALLDIVT